MLTFLVRWRPLVAVVIIMAVKEEVRLSSIKSQGTDGSVNRFISIERYSDSYIRIRNMAVKQS